MEVLESFLDAVGRTPLVRLTKVTRGLRPTILAKLEMLNPGGSVKDRIGLRMIEAAEREGRLRPGGTGKAYFIAYNLRQIRQITFTTNRRKIASMATVYTHATTPLSMEVGVNDALYFSTPTGIYRLIQS